MKAYQTDNLGFLIGEVKAQESPLEPGKFLIPGGAYPEEPPQYGENEIPKRVGNAWQIVPNFSGKLYFHKTTRTAKIFELGEEFDSNYTDAVPLENERYQKLEDGQWVVDEAEKLIQTKEQLKSKLKSFFESKVQSYRSVITVDGIQWDSGQKYISNIDTLISVHSRHPYQIEIPDWRDANNNFHSVSLEQLTNIRYAIEKDMFLEGVRLYGIKWTKEGEIESLTLETIDSYDVTGGWD